jgi:hypothetical protein
MADANVRGIMFWASIYMLCRFGLWVLSPILYIWTLYLAYLTSFVAVLISLVVPVGPQVYFIWQIWNDTGSLSNLYTVLCAAWVAFALIGILTRMKAETLGS